MQITAISVQANNQNRVNVSVDGKYRFSLDVFQVGELGIKVGSKYSQDELVELEEASQFGKLYARTLEYCMIRPHSVREVRDYLYKKTKPKSYRARATGEIKQQPGVSQANADRVLERLIDKKYVDDEQFTRYWLENRRQATGVSRRKLEAELMAKGVDRTIIENAALESGRTDDDELAKVIAKKSRLYSDRQKFTAYLSRQGFRYDDIKQALAEQEGETS